MYNEIYLKNTYEEIVSIIEENSRVLDLGCGDGELLQLLHMKKKTYGLGIDISTDEVLKCIKRGVSVIQEDIDEGLDQYKDQAYDYVILSETLQAVKRPDYVLDQIVRIGKKAIVSFPNFACWKLSLKFLFSGRMPKSSILPFEWYNTPNIHLLTINDFKDFCKARGIDILKQIYLINKGVRLKFNPGLENLFAEEAIFLIQRHTTEKIAIKEINIANGKEIKK